MPDELYARRGIIIFAHIESYMKNLPNLLTLANLFFGVCAVVFALSAYPYFQQAEDGTGQYWQIQGMDKMYLSSLFIVLAALMDLLDGLAARLLGAESAMGKDLDSLADVVSFGVAPAVIMYQLLWRAYMKEPNALETPFWVMAPALLIACFAAWRLARFNTMEERHPYFIGMPAPAAGIFVAMFPLVLFFEFETMGQWLEQRSVLYVLIALVCYLMVSDHPFLKWNTGKGLKGSWPIIAIVLATAICWPFLGFGALVIGFLAYVIASFVYPYSRLKAE